MLCNRYIKRAKRYKLICCNYSFLDEMGTFYLLKMIRKVSSAIFFFNLLLRVRKAPAGVFIQYTMVRLLYFVQVVLYSCRLELFFQLFLQIPIQYAHCVVYIGHAISGLSVVPKHSAVPLLLSLLQ